MPTMRLRVVCGLSDTAATRSPTRRLRSVDFPALGRPTSATVPARAPPAAGISRSSVIAKEAAPQAALDPIHLAVVGLVIVALTVQHAVEEQRSELALERLATRGGLATRLGHAYHDVTQMRLRQGGLTWKRQHVGHLVPAAKVAVEGAHGGIAAQPHTEALGL